MNEIKKGTNCFYIGRKRTPLAEIKYSYEENQIIIMNTFVAVELRGQNIARKLLKMVVDLARQENKKIIPRCSFAEIELNKNKDYVDVIN